MANINLEKLSPEELDQLAREARNAAKEKRKQEQEKAIMTIGSLVYVNAASIINCHGIDLKIRKAIAKEMKMNIPSNGDGLSKISAPQTETQES